MVGKQGVRSGGGGDDEFVRGENDSVLCRSALDLEGVWCGVVRCVRLVGPGGCLRAAVGAPGRDWTPESMDVAARVLRYLGGAG